MQRKLTILLALAPILVTLSPAPVEAAGECGSGTTHVGSTGASCAVDASHGLPVPGPTPSAGCTAFLTEQEHKPTLSDTVYTTSYEVYTIWAAPPGTTWCGGVVRATIDGQVYQHKLTTPSFGVYKLSATVNGLSHGSHRADFQIGVENRVIWIFDQIACGTSQLSESATSGSSARVQVTFTGASPTCAVATWGIKVDGKDVTPTATRTKSGNAYTINYEPTPKLGGGTHNVEAWIEEQCCRPDGTRNKDSASWSFTIPDCGTHALQLVEWGPTNGADARFSVYARFRDVDFACNLAESYMRIDGIDTRTRPTREGNDWVFNYFPSQDFLLFIPHTVEVYLKEECCNNVGESNEGRHSWTFTAGLVGEDYDDRLPGFEGTQATPSVLGIPSTRTTLHLTPVHYSWQWWGLESIHLSTALTLRFEMNGGAVVDETIPLMV